MDRYLPDCYYVFRDLRYVRRETERREAEERDRQEWIRGVKRRLGLVGIGEIPFIIEWSPDPRCRCSFVLNGERVSLGRPCPVHEAAA
jgi:hypothetical protein